MRPAGLLCVLALGAATGVGCGSSGGSIPSSDASALNASLDRVAAAVAAGDCAAANAALLNVRSELRSLQGKIPTKLSHNFTQGYNALQTAATTDCQTAAQQQTTTTQQTTTQNTTPTVSTATTTTTPTATTPDTTTTPPTDTTPTTTPTTTPSTGGATPGTTTTTGQTPGTGFRGTGSGKDKFKVKHGRKRGKGE